MGFDVYGKKATAKVGEYFRHNVWWWRPLADFITEHAPREAKYCRYWHSNDGDGLNKKQAIALADKLDALIADGTVTKYVEMRDMRLSSLPRETCRYCNGTGIRVDEVGEKAGFPNEIVKIGPDDEPGNPRAGLKGWCNGCNGWGTSKNAETWYHMEASSVKEFADFARHSGGFRIC